ncbi:MAG: GrpB family protein [Saprospiraceae bacterium]|nr:GrpB family protein [Saprospiraceae bacterium]MCB9323180.1 GrpB family protein [Lewinellaceae bacterium]
MKIEIEKYNPGWIHVFHQLKMELLTLLAPLNPRVEHIGSTSVPGLAAKPVIDIAVGIEKVQDLDRTIEPMLRQHYIYYEVYNSAMPLRRLFVGLKDKKNHVLFKHTYKEGDSIPHESILAHRLCHVHIWQFGTSEWIRHIAFRDYLKENDTLKSQYEALKKQLSEKTWSDGNEYNQGKNSFIKTIEAKAVAWYNEKQKAIQQRLL